MPPMKGGRPQGADAGVGAALAHAPVADMHNSGPPVSYAPQLDLLRDFSPLEGSPPPAIAESEQPDRPAERRGRAPGSLNKRTEAWVSYILARNASPLESLARIVTMGPLVLAREMKLAPSEAFREWRACAEAVLPYLHQKLPAAVLLDATVTGSASQLHLLAVQSIAAEQQAEQAAAGRGVDIVVPTLQEIIAVQDAIQAEEMERARHIDPAPAR